MLARGSPTVLDFVVALVSGVAAAYAMGRPNLLSALPGVAIAAALGATPAAVNGRIFPIDGSLLTWPGTRIGRALPALLELHAEVLAVAA